MTLARPTFREAFLFWLKLGFINFGGPTGQIAIMHKELVDRRRWVSDERFFHALNYCMLLPGPEATQLAIYVGWLLHDVVGGLVAGVLFVLPSVLVLLALGWVYVTFGNVALVAGLFLGLKAAVVAIVAHAVLRIARRALKRAVMIAVAAAAFVALYVLHVSFPIVIVAAALLGLALYRFAPRVVITAAEERARRDDMPTPSHALPSARRAWRILAVGALVTLVPLAALAVVGGVLRDDGFFFVKASYVTFGGAYAVLSYIAQEAVQRYHWLTAPQMVDGLGLAETTPGPLIMVVTFVGFMAGWSATHALAWAVAGGLVATYFTFLPSFVFVLVGGPYVEKLRADRRLSAALTTITAAVVGVVLNLAVFLALQVLAPGGVVAWFPLALAVAAFVAMLAWDVGVVPVVVAGAALGLLGRLLVR
jgi:chromate transporter